MMTDKTTRRIIDDLCNMQGRAYDRHNLTGAPYGDKYISIVFEIAAEILSAYNIYELTPAVIEGITQNNAHMAGNAIDIIKRLERPACYEFIH